LANLADAKVTQHDNSIALQEQVLGFQVSAIKHIIQRQSRSVIVISIWRGAGIWLLNELRCKLYQQLQTVAYTA
jgi:hypothetical protein